MEIRIRPLQTAELSAASILIREVFDTFEAPGYPPEGVETFRRFTAPETLTARLHSGEMSIWGAFCGQQLTGVLASRSPSHISLLFVDTPYHRQGIARALFSVFRDHCLAARPVLRHITVNSSPYAVEIYRRLGFTTTDAELTADGIRYTPMEYPL